MSEDLIKVVVDYNFSDKNEKNKISTGGFINCPFEKFDRSFIPNSSLIID